MALNQYPLPKDLQVLVEIVHSGSFSGAAERLGQTPAFVTKRIHILESALNTTLLNRSAHGIALTESGKRCYDHALNVLNHMQTLVDDVTQMKTRPAGMIRIGCSFGFGRTHIAPAITELMRQYPELQIHFELFDRQIDLSRDGIDLDIRINDDIAENYIARRLAENKRILCASPAYIEKHGLPASLGELTGHDCLITKERDVTPGIWELERSGEKKSVKISGHLSSNSGEIVLRWALEGKGVILRSEWDVMPFLERGELVRILPEYSQSANIWAVYQEPLYQSVKLRVCVEYLTEYCQRLFGGLEKR
ncbi:transcriptional activator TtdR [Leminorella grimontii]|uniref:Transcriptional activator TtdR n=1 Tax=Leminorella grimontii TaxID=82981 RepID=A0AAV5N2L2_9GAMM|nr:LysR family transcriptional regulator [Leminorella grimontii]KFC95187.1 putative LysR family transcriptional regulator [Leminorella grimontii ATCC 33999 = DSM 5078]GKX56215.1 transcriptional activator TtdR [Leminorella grimontii]GKX60395.1 transcriptional activator TtdR [Leminorella grimontii]